MKFSTLFLSSLVSVFLQGCAHAPLLNGGPTELFGEPSAACDRLGKFIGNAGNGLISGSQNSADISLKENIMKVGGDTFFSLNKYRKGNVYYSEGFAFKCPSIETATLDQQKVKCNLGDKDACMAVGNLVMKEFVKTIPQTFEASVPVFYKFFKSDVWPHVFNNLVVGCNKKIPNWCNNLELAKTLNDGMERNYQDLVACKRDDAKKCHEIAVRLAQGNSEEAKRFAEMGCNLGAKNSCDFETILANRALVEAQKKLINEQQQHVANTSRNESYRTIAEINLLEEQRYDITSRRVSESLRAFGNWLSYGNSQ